MSRSPADGHRHHLLALLRGNAVLWECLERVAELDLPDWYLGAGCVTQTVWNAAHGKPPGEDIDDHDLVYFDAGDLGEEAEDAVVTGAQEAVTGLPIRLDVKNQARVHLWYWQRFGYGIEPYRSTEAAIRTWPTTATAVGVRLTGGDPVVFAPFGLADLFGLVVRANRVQVTPAIYQGKVARWRRFWPDLTVLPWDDGIGAPRRA
ncbi:MAG: nucleotidyltransferase family protein [Spirochaetaceae bacterium]|nr:nucleotidyltransferase family protein [Spirochaetaceae bacterium]